MKHKLILGLIGVFLLSSFVLKAEAGLTHFPHGVSSFGVPVLEGDDDGQVWGSTYFVSTDTSIASDSNEGTTPDYPFLTIQAAINACTTAKGDRIFIQNGAYTEDLTITKDDIQLIGQSASDVIVTGATDATDVLVITGNEVTIKNMQFDGYDTGSDISLIKVGAVATATSGIKIINCHFIGNEYHIESYSSSEMLIVGNHFITLDDVTDGAAVSLSGSDNCVVFGNKFFLDNASDGIIHDNADNLEVAYNVAVGDDDTGASTAAFVFITGNDATSELSLHDNSVTLFGAVIAESGAAVAAHGLGTSDVTVANLIANGDGNNGLGCTTGFDTTGL